MSTAFVYSIEVIITLETLQFNLFFEKVDKYYLLTSFCIECKTDAADNFKAVARRNGIKVLSPNRETDETHGATAGMYFICVVQLKDKIVMPPDQHPCPPPCYSLLLQTRLVVPKLFGLIKTSLKT